DITYSDPFIVVTICLFDFGVRHPDPLRQQGADLLEQKSLPLLRLELTRCNRGYLTPQYRLIARETEPTLLLERRHLSNGVFEFLLRDHHPVLLGQTQEDGAFGQLFQGHLAEIKLGAEVHLWHAQDGAIPLL